MNIEKIERLMKSVGRSMSTDAFTDQEYLVFVANLLFAFGKTGLETRQEHGDVNVNDAFNIELALNQDPNDPHLASLLQGHALIKWSESFKA